jgi:hypothetical protein
MKPSLRPTAILGLTLTAGTVFMARKETQDPPVFTLAFVDAGEKVQFCPPDQTAAAQVRIQDKKTVVSVTCISDLTLNKSRVLPDVMDKRATVLCESGKPLYIRAEAQGHFTVVAGYCGGEHKLEFVRDKQPSQSLNVRNTNNSL